MEAKLLASLFSFLSIFLAIYAEALALNVVDDASSESNEFELEAAAIYYGDSSVNFGEPFSITCIIPVTDPIYWTKDGEPITRHNLRHGRDEHSYIPSESPIEGEKHKIEAHISVRHALKVHEGKYQCNDLHSSYHILRVRSLATSVANEFSTLSGYESIFDLTPNSLDKLFSRTNLEQQAATPAVVVPPHQTDIIGPLPLPTQATPQQHNRQGHHHNHPKLIERRLNFMNNTSNHYGDGKGHFDGDVEANYEFIGGLMHPSEYMPPTSKFSNAAINELTTVPWRMTPIMRHGPPPVFPTPRTTWLTPTVVTLTSATGSVAPVSPPLPHIPHVVQHQMPIYMHTDGSSSSSSNINNNNRHNQQQQQQQQHHQHHHAGNTIISGTSEQPRFPLQTIQTSHQQQQQQQHQNQHQTTQSGGMHFPTVTTVPINPLHHPNGATQQHQYQRIHHQQQPHQQQQLHHHQSQQYNLPMMENVQWVSNPNTNPNQYTTTTLFSPKSTMPSTFPPTANDIATPTATTATTTTSMTTQKPKESGLQANYNNKEKKIKYFEILKPLVLSCKGNDDNLELTWLKNGTDVKSIPALQGRFKILPKESTFMIDRAEATDDGLYSCKNDVSSADITVIARVIVRVPSNVGVVQGEKISIPCTVLGTNVELSWVKDNKTITNGTRFTLYADEKKIENAILTLENVSMEDRGEYKCVGRNAVDELREYESSDTSYIRVKGRLAALWPFLGICAEVLILCLIIIIYEKRRNKSELEESDTDPQDQRKKRRNYD